MTRSRVADRYAGSILEMAIEQQSLPQVEQDLATLQAAIGGSRDLRNLLASPIIDDHRKEQILAQVFDGKVSPLVSRFVALLARKGRAQELPDVVAVFFQQLDRHRRIISAKITSAVTLDDEQLGRIVQALERMTNSTVRAAYEVDPTIVGGFRALLDDRMIDASVRHQLDRLHQTLTEG